MHKSSGGIKYGNTQLPFKQATLTVVGPALRGVFIVILAKIITLVKIITLAKVIKFGFQPNFIYFS